jgi:iron complex transport system ATP-binding protein
VKTQQLNVYRGPCAILYDLNIDIPQGKWTSVIGPNGAGKSSLLQAIAGLLKWDGSITIDGVDISAFTIVIGKFSESTEIQVTPESSE